MAEKTTIAWARSTFNAWIGCTKVGPGCDNCYAEALDKRHRWGGAEHWGAGVPRFRTSAKNWKHPIEWNKLAELEQRTGILTLGSEWKGRVGFWPVFCASLADVFDNEVSPQWRGDLWKLISSTPNLSWLLVTKRVGNVYNMVPWAWQARFPDNVRLLITVCNQEEADRDIPKLLALPCKNGVSYEPALGPINFRPWLSPRGHVNWGDNKNPSIEDQRAVLAIAKAAYYEGGSRLIEWVIVGGESTQGAGKARPFDLSWAPRRRRSCRVAGRSADPRIPRSNSSGPCRLIFIGVVAMRKEIELGDEAKDKISGFAGIVTGCTVWLNGCRRFMLTPQKLDKDGKPREAQWFDDVQVVLVKAIAAPKAAPAGGPRDAPSRAADPTR